MHVAQAHAQACVPALQACLEGSLLCHKLSVLPTIGMSVRFVECMMIMFGFRLSDKLMNVCTADPSVSLLFFYACVPSW